MKNKILETKKVVQLPPKMLGLGLNVGPSFNLKFHQFLHLRSMSISLSPPPKMDGDGTMLRVC